MTRTWAATDATHWASDSMMEQFGNAANYNVVTGCGYTPSGANMSVTVAAGTITHNGSEVTVAGNSVTLVADGTNPRWTWVCINSAGTAVIVSGTPAADPTEPEVGDNVEVALFYVAAGGTVASSQGNVDRRLFAPTVTDLNSAQLTADSASNATTTLADVTGLAATLSASTTYLFEATIHYTAPTAGDYKFTFTSPASSTIYWMCNYTNTSGTGTIGSVAVSGTTLSATGFATGTGIINVWGSVIVAGTAGNLQFQHALVTASGSCVTKAKSRLVVY